MYVLIRNLIIIGSTFTYEHLNEKNLNLYSIDVYVHRVICIGIYIKKYSVKENVVLIEDKNKQIFPFCYSTS